MRHAFTASISGRVQLVMFRDFVQRKATKLGVVGEVQNMPDGTVRVVAEGSEDALKKLETHLHFGPLLARVDSVSLARGVPTGQYKKFSIKY